MSSNPPSGAGTALTLSKCINLMLVLIILMPVVNGALQAIVQARRQRLLKWASSFQSFTEFPKLEAMAPVPPAPSKASAPSAMESPDLSQETSVVSQQALVAKGISLWWLRRALQRL